MLTLNHMQLKLGTSCGQGDPCRTSIVVQEIWLGGKPLQSCLAFGGLMLCCMHVGLHYQLRRKIRIKYGMPVRPLPV
jgi:hypothetical protein